MLSDVQKSDKQRSFISVSPKLMEFPRDAQRDGSKLAAKREKRSLLRGTSSTLMKEVSVHMISNRCIEVHTSPVERPSVPPWFAEVVIVVQHLAAKGLLDAFAHQMRLVRGRFGTYEPLDFLALLLGYAMSGERTLADFFERLAPFGSAFMALFGRRYLPHRSSLSRFLADVDRPCAGSVSHALRAAELSRRVDSRNHRWHLGSTRTPLHCL